MYKVLIPISYWEGFLPTPRCRKMRYREVSGTFEATVCEVKPEEFPVGLRFENFIMQLERPERRWIDLHWYNGKLWKLSRASDYSAKGKWEDPVPADKLKELLVPAKYDVGVSPDKENCVKAIRKRAERWIVCNGLLYEVSGEPMYNICTFGLGHNHAGTGTALDVSCRYNGNLPSKWYFNAFQRDQAIAAAKEVAMRRKDTESIWYIEAAERIEVLIPECVQADPQNWNKPGDQWLNQLEDITETSSSPFTAGLLMCMACKR